MPQQPTLQCAAPLSGSHMPIASHMNHVHLLPVSPILLHMSGCARYLKPHISFESKPHKVQLLGACRWSDWLQVFLMSRLCWLPSSMWGSHMGGNLHLRQHSLLALWGYVLCSCAPVASQVHHSLPLLARPVLALLVIRNACIGSDCPDPSQLLIKLKDR